MDSGVKTIRRRVPPEEQLAGLAEEAAELAQAALKYRRAMDGTNPTPTSPDVAKAALLEEIADVLLYLGVLGCVSRVSADGDIVDTMEAKILRWARRLEGEA